MKLREKKKGKRGNSGRGSDINSFFFVLRDGRCPLSTLLLLWRHGIANQQEQVHTHAVAQKKERSQWAEGGKNMRRQRRSGTAWHFGALVSAAARPRRFVGPDASVKVRLGFPASYDKRIITLPQCSSCRAPRAVELPSAFLLLFLLIQTQQDSTITF